MLYLREISIAARTFHFIVDVKQWATKNHIGTTTISSAPPSFHYGGQRARNLVFPFSLPIITVIPEFTLSLSKGRRDLVFELCAIYSSVARNLVFTFHQHQYSTPFGVARQRGGAAYPGYHAGLLLFKLFGLGITIIERASPLPAPSSPRLQL